MNIILSSFDFNISRLGRLVTEWLVKNMILLAIYDVTVDVSVIANTKDHKQTYYF